jgi:hypothetical protein
MNLANQTMRESFLEKLERCEANINMMPDYEAGFIRDMRRKFDERETQEDLGINPWNPSARQWNFLTHIYDMVR